MSRNRHAITIMLLHIVCSSLVERKDEGTKHVVEAFEQLRVCKAEISELESGPFVSKENDKGSLTLFLDIPGLLSRNLPSFLSSSPASGPSQRSGLNDFASAK
jgi:hypothetical protein